MWITEPSSARCEERIDEVDVKIKKSEWKAKLQKMRAQIQGMKNNVYNGDED